MPVGFGDIVKLMVASRYFRPRLEVVERLYALED